ncbi:exodeoxyribonuclease V subunit alpha [Glaciecola sp. MF2-115]|uniref:exodeoxyribonuclease V subunit alpha n=1 Tax=Glaciecola sp. MF2-115 TaxID=3384827 RepID=UPI0039A278AE
MLFSLPNKLVKEIGYASCSECLFTLQDVQSIDYYFATNALTKRFESVPEHTFFTEQDSLSQMFHILIALSYFLRQGHSCLTISAIAKQRYWAELEQDQELISSEENDRNAKDGFLFIDEERLQLIIQDFYDICSARKDIVWEHGCLYTARYANYEDIVAAFFKERQSNETYQNAILQTCSSDLWTALFPNKLNKSIDWQQISVLNGLLAKTSIISGGAGTGKTYTVARLLLSWLFTQERNMPRNTRLLLAAPTGKAAQRLNESILGEFSNLIKANESKANESQHSQVVSIIELLKPMIEAKTIHRLLGLGMHGIEPRYNEKKQLDCDFLVIDEASMIDLAMMAKLLRALPKDAKLVLIGDANQLPSVESGGLLKDLVNQDNWQEAAHSNDFSCVYSSQHAQILNQVVSSFPIGPEEALLSKQPASQTIQYDHVTFLQKSMRSQSEIGNMAKRILKGDAKEFIKHISAYKSIEFGSQTRSNQNERERNEREQTAQQMSLAMSDEVISWHEEAYTQTGVLKPALIEHIAQQYEPIFESNSALEAIAQLQKYRLLSGTKKGRLGTEFLNIQIEQELRKRFTHIDAGHMYRGMPIMIVQNDYRLKLFNGDIGVIWSNDEGQLRACFNDPENASQHISFSVSSLPAFELVYAMTIHKTQGSEFAHVDILLPNSLKGSASAQSAQHLSRELLYTGVTRAQTSIGLIANTAVLKACIENTSTRFSGLKRKLLS